MADESDPGGVVLRRGPVPADRIVAILEDAEHGGYLWGCGMHRASVVRVVARSARGRSTHYEWRAWCVLSPELGGTGFRRNGSCPAPKPAMVAALEALTEAAGRA